MKNILRTNNKQNFNFQSFSLHLKGTDPIIKMMNYKSYASGEVDHSSYWERSSQVNNILKKYKLNELLTVCGSITSCIMIRLFGKTYFMDRVAINQFCTVTFLVCIFVLII